MKKYKLLKDLPGKKAGELITVYANDRRVSWFDKGEFETTVDVHNPEYFEEVKEEPEIVKITKLFEELKTKTQNHFNDLASEVKKKSEIAKEKLKQKEKKDYVPGDELRTLDELLRKIEFFGKEKSSTPDTLRLIKIGTIPSTNTDIYVSKNGKITYKVGELVELYERKSSEKRVIDKVIENIKEEVLEPKAIYTTFAHSANEILITERGMKLLQRGENITDAKENIVVKYKPEAVVGKLDRKGKFDEILKTVKESIGKTDEYLPLFGREVEIIDSYRKAKAVGIKVNKILLVPHGIVCVGDPSVISDETSDGFKGIL